MVRIKFWKHKLFTGEEFLLFRCNICGKTSIAPLSVITGRESRSCYHCGSTLRFRSLIDALSTELFGKSIILTEFPIRKDIKGIGMSDSAIYADKLSKKLNFINTYYHKDPMLDITTLNPEYMGEFDFVITSDVFEHVNPPVNRAFKNLYQLLKETGIVIFSVPYNKTGNTIEHFPELYEYNIERKGKNKILVNRTKSGELQIFKNLSFHGGDGATLEMRIFSESGINELLLNAGFTEVKICNTNKPEFGIIWNQDHSFPILAKKSNRANS